MKKLLFVLALLSGRWASAQTTCPPLQLKAFHNKQEIKTTGSAVTPTVILTLTNDPACPTAVSYQVKKVEITLVRDKRPVLPARTVEGPEVDLTGFAKLSQPGDRLYMEVRDAVATPAGGQSTSYKLADGRSLVLNWVLTK